MSLIINYSIVVFAMLLIYAAVWGFRENTSRNSSKYWVVRQGIIFAILNFGVVYLADFVSIDSEYLAPIFIISFIGIFISPLVGLIAATIPLMLYPIIGEVNWIDTLTIYVMELFMLSVVWFLKEIKIIKQGAIYIVSTAIALVITVLTRYVIEASTIHWWVTIVSSLCFAGIIYFGGAFIKRFYLHSQELQMVARYDDLTTDRKIVRPAFAAETLTAYTVENSIETGALVIIELTGLTKIKKELGERIGDIYISDVIEKLSLQLINTDYVLLKSSTEHYGFFMKYEKKMTNLSLSLEGNNSLSRKESDPLKMVEDILLEIPRTFKHGDREYRIQVRGGVSLYGIQSCHFDDLLEFSEYTLRSKNWFRSTNIAQLFDTTIHRQFVGDKKQLAYLEDITSISTLYTKFSPVVDIRNNTTIGYNYNVYTNDHEYRSYEDVKFEAERQGLSLVLEKVAATVAVKTFKSVEEIKDKVLFLDFPAVAFIDENYNEFNLLSKLVGMGYRPNQIILQLEVNEDIINDEKFIKTVNFFKKASVKISIKGIEADKFKSNWLELIQPNYASISLKSTRLWLNTRETTELLDTYNQYCDKLGIILIVTDLKSSYQLKNFYKIGFKGVTGSFVASPDSDSPKVKYAFKQTLRKIIREERENGWI